MNLPEKIVQDILFSVENLWKNDHKKNFQSTLEVIKNRPSSIYLINNDRPHLLTFFRYYTIHSAPEEHLALLRRFF